MSDILRAKFTQNPHLTQLLLSTDTLHLHEASSDLKWATGAELASKALQTGSWPGSDRMGFLLENLRAELRGDDPTPITDAPPSTDSPPPLEADDLSPMPEDEDEPPAQPSFSPSHPTTQPPQTNTLTPASPSSSQMTQTTYAGIVQTPSGQTNQFIPEHSRHSTVPTVPPLMQAHVHKPLSPKSCPPPSHPYPPTGRTSPSYTSVVNQRPNYKPGARFNSRRKSLQPFTSDRAPVRRSARLCPNTAVPLSQP